jgi:ribbon-helix-helix protein
MGSNEGKTVLRCPLSPRSSVLTAYGHVCAGMTLCDPMERKALFLKEEQIEKLQKLSDKTGAPLAELVRRAIDKYLQERAKELK